MASDSGSEPFLRMRRLSGVSDQYGLNMNKFILILSFIVPSISFAVEFGISTSGEAVSVDFWPNRDEVKKVGLYGRFVWDFEDYEDGSVVSICSDGSVSGSSGSGTCSGHGGVSGEKLAEFTRYGFILGPTYWVTNRVRLHGGIVLGVYNSDVNIGDEGKLDFNEYGVDVGISCSFLGVDSPRVVLSYESEQEQTFLGLSFP